MASPQTFSQEHQRVATLLKTCVGIGFERTSSADGVYKRASYPVHCKWVGWFLAERTAAGKGVLWGWL